MPSSLDPESMKGKLFVLVIDKLVIGAILALFFFGYQYWKTGDDRKYNERINSEAREYNSIIRNSQDEFKRAQFIKELLPIVLNENETIQSRIEILGSLIRTQSIDPSSAIAISLSMLREGRLAQKDSGIPNDVLVNSFVRMLGPIIPDVLPEILDAYDYYPNISGAPSGYASVLIRAFEHAWRHNSTKELKVLDDPGFVADNLATIDKILPQAHLQYKEWNDTSPLVLRLIRDIQILKNAREENETVTAARRRLSERLGITSNDAEAIQLSTALFFEIRGVLSDTAFVRQAFAVVMQPDKVTKTFSKLARLEKHNPYLHQFTAAERFLLRASSANPEGESLAIPVVKSFLERLQNEEIEFGNFPIERTMVCVLVLSMSAKEPDRKRRERAEKLLEAFAVLPETKLHAANLGFLAQVPIATGRCAD